MIACPKCSGPSSRVMDKRNKPDGRIVRRRQCDDCGSRYTTYEVIVADRYRFREQKHDPMRRLRPEASA